MNSVDHQELARLQALTESNLLDTPSSPVLNTLLKIAKETFSVNIAAVSLIDKKRQWFKAKVGINICETAREISFCDHTIKQDIAMIVEDTKLSEVFIDNPLVTDYPHIRFYSGIPIRSSTGHKLGAFCLIHNEPKIFSKEDVALQAKFARLVEIELDNLSHTHNVNSPTAEQVNKAVFRAQHVFLDTDNEKLTFNILLNDLLELSESDFGYIGEVKYSADESSERQYLEMKSVCEITSNDEINVPYNNADKNALNLRDIEDLLGFSFTSGENLIINDFSAVADTKAPALKDIMVTSYCAIPIRSKNTIIGQIGLANRKKCYSKAFINTIEAITYTVGVLIERSKLLQEKQNDTRRLYNAAHIDETSGLPNRRSLSDYLDTIVSGSNGPSTFSICFLDLDGFKLINDTYGHHDGDKLLSIIGEKLKQVTRKEDFVARISGDEFVVVLHHASVEIYQRILEAINTPFQLERGIVKVSASMGIAKYPDDGSDMDQLLRYADQAMYIAKHKGKNQAVHFNVNLYREEQRKSEAMTEVAQALINNEIKPYFQPKFSVTSKQILGFEILSRWAHKEKGILSPAFFLPSIQETHVQVAFDEFIFTLVPDLLDNLHKLDAQFTLNINVSPEYFNSEDFLSRIEKIACEHPNKVSYLILEIVESTALGDLDSAVERLHYCKKLGYRISLDDFGTSFSSLTYFRSLPADEVKIDRTFIADILTDPQDVAITKAIINMAAAFCRNVVAEGVESEEQLALLKEMGCQTAQGYLVAKPMPFDEIENFLTQQQEI